MCPDDCQQLTDSMVLNAQQYRCSASAQIETYSEATAALSVNSGIVVGILGHAHAVLEQESDGTWIVLDPFNGRIHYWHAARERAVMLLTSPIQVTAIVD